MFNRLKVGPARLNDGQESLMVRGGNAGEMMVSQYAPTNYELALRNQAYIYHIASQALIITATTGNSPTIINPPGSGVLWVPLSLSLSWISGVHVAGSLVWCETLNVSGVATASPILTATLVAPRAARRGQVGSPKCLWSPSTNTFTAAPTAFFAAGINIATEYVTTVVNTAGPLGIQDAVFFVKYNAEFVVEPGNAVTLCYSVTTSTALFQITLCGAEIPINVGQ